MHTAYIVQEGSANKPKSRLTLKVLTRTKAGSTYCFQSSTPGSGCRAQHRLGSWPLISSSTQGKQKLHLRKQAAIKRNWGKKKRGIVLRVLTRQGPHPQRAHTPYFKTYSFFSKQNEEAFSKPKPVGRFSVTRSSSTCLDSNSSQQKSGA